MTQDPHKNTVKKIVSSRKFIFICLLLALILLSSYYVLNYQQHLEYPNTGVILKHYPLGETVSVSGEVTEVHDNGFTLLDKYHTIEVSYTVFSGEKMSTGDHVEVLGVLGNSNQITASKIQFVSDFDYNFMLIRSAIVLLIFLFFFRRYWRFDFKKLEFRRLK